MSAALRDREKVHAGTVGQWRAWLAEHAGSSSGVWPVSWKATGRLRISYDDAVTEALARGWVDSRPGSLDEERTVFQFAPRKPGSGWSRPNKVRVERLLARAACSRPGRRSSTRRRRSGARRAGRRAGSGTPFRR